MDPGRTLEVAVAVSRSQEAKAGLEPGYLLGEAWIAANAAARRWRSGGGASFNTYVGTRTRGALWDVLTKDDARWWDVLEWEPRVTAQPTLRLEAEEVLARVASRTTPRHALVLALTACGFTQTEIGNRLGGIRQPSVAFLYRRAVEAGRSGT